MIHIGKPYIKKGNKKSKLCSLVEIDGKKEEIYYEVDKKYEDFLCYERSDSFIVGLLHFAMSKGENIETEAPVSEKLYHQLSAYVIPTFKKYLYDKEILISSDYEKVDISEGNAVGTGLSSGVDSFDTIYNHTNLENSNFNITHLTFFNVGSHGSGEKSQILYQQRLSFARKLAAELDYDLIEINSNISEIINMNFVQTHTFRSFSAVLALQKFFKVYYYGSGYPIEEFMITKNSSAYYDLFSTMYLSTENTDFFSAGIEKSRIEKVEDITEFKPTYKNLNVCFKEDYNCGVCEKCIRTQLELYSVEKLQLYKDVFNLNQFYSKKNLYFGKMLANQNQSNYNDIKNKMKENKLKIPFISNFYALPFRINNFLQKYRN